MTRFPQCKDCAFQGVEPAICDECKDADQFSESDRDDGINEMPIYFRPWDNPT